MKEIMLPYVFICWILVKTGLVKWTLKNAVIIVGIGVVLALALFTAHRFWSPADLTNSTTVKAPHAVLSPLIGQEVEAVFVEMRIADQTFRGIEVGQFAEFYVDAYPGEIFRGRVHSVTTGTGEAAVSVINGSQHVRQHVGNNMGSHGRTIIIEFIEPAGYNVPIGATGAGWVSAKKPHPLLGFMDIIGAATVRLKAYKSYLSAM
ncbi:hypothetical protein ACHELY_000564 [Vibrio vulnificus]